MTIYNEQDNMIMTIHQNNDYLARIEQSLITLNSWLRLFF